MVAEYLHYNTATTLKAAAMQGGEAVEDPYMPGVPMLRWVPL